MVCFKETPEGLLVFLLLLLQVRRTEVKLGGTGDPVLVVSRL